jgi:hypothetical protein
MPAKKKLKPAERYTLAELQSMQTVHQGHFDDVKFENSKYRVLLSRCKIADGMPYDNQVTVLEKINNEWETIDQYEAK